MHLECDLRLCTFLPLIYHIADQIFSLPAFLSGGTLVMGRGYDPRAIAETLDEERITALWGGSPAMLTDLADELEADPSLDASAMGMTIYGWTAAAPELVDRLKARCHPELVVCEILGQTEAISCSRFWPDKWPELFRETAPAQNYVGVPNPLLAADVVDEDGNSLRGTVGVPGEVVYRSPVVTPGYYKDEAATRQAFRGGWFHSGDVCTYDADGLRIMVDRSKDIVKSGGENVSSLRVEAVLFQHPHVQKSAVVGLPHEQWGEAVTAFVIARGRGERRPRRARRVVPRAPCGLRDPEAGRARRRAARDGRRQGPQVQAPGGPRRSSTTTDRGRLALAPVAGPRVLGKGQRHAWRPARPVPCRLRRPRRRRAHGAVPRARLARHGRAARRPDRRPARRSPRRRRPCIRSSS